MYPTPVAESTMQRDMGAAKEVVDFLAGLYGRYPNNQLVLQQQDEQHEGKFRMEPSLTIPFFLWLEFNQGPNITTVHEISHFFSNDLFGGDGRWLYMHWLDEGISGWSEDQYIAGYLGLDSILGSIEGKSVGYFEDGYEKLKNGDNLFGKKLFEERGQYEMISGGTWVETTGEYHPWFSAHIIGHLFFQSLAEDYEMSEVEIGDFLKELVRNAEDGRSIGVEDLIEAVEKVSGENIRPLLQLLEPGIVFSGEWGEYNGYKYGGYKGKKFMVERFLKEYPQYATERVSWID